MAMDPFSAASKPLPPAFLLNSKQPLEFAATLSGGALLTPFELCGEHTSKSKGKRPQEHVPNIPASSSATNSPIYLHHRMPSGKSSSSFGLESLKLSEESERRSFMADRGKVHAMPEVGSDDWMDNMVAKCVDKANLTVDLSNFGLTHLSEHISSLQNLVILPSRSPAPPPYIDSPSHPDTAKLSDPSSPRRPGSATGGHRASPGYLANEKTTPNMFMAGRTFQRYASAPSGSLGAPSPAQARMREMSSGAPPGARLTGSGSPIQHVNIASGLPSTSTLNTRPFQRVPSKGFAPPGSAVDDEEEELLWAGEADSGAGVSPNRSGLAPAQLLQPSPHTLGLGAPFENLSAPGARPLTNSKQGLFTRKVSFQDAPDAQASISSASPRLFHRSSSGTDPATASPSSPESRRRLRATTSAPATSLDSPKDTTAKTRAFLRTASGTISPATNGKWSGVGNGDVVLMLANNALTTLPSALFQITNLVFLSLRHNRLTSLPAAIGQLRNLKELNLGNNKIETFPPTLLDLNLDSFLFSSNPLRMPPAGVQLGLVASGRRLGPLETFSASMPSLRSLCISVLLSSRQPDDLPPFLSEFDWEPEAGSQYSHGLQDAKALHDTQSFLTLEECETITTSLRSSYRTSAAASRKIKHIIPDPSFSPSARPRQSAQRRGHDDASTNVYFRPCPNPAHTARVSMSRAEEGRITRRVYAHRPAEERIEWTKVGGSGEAVPILWKGCSPGCLDFLEMAEEVEDEEGEATETDEKDGFDLADLEGDWTL